MAPRKKGRKEFLGVKAMRMTSVTETNTGKMERLTKHFNIVHGIKNDMSSHIFNLKEKLLSKEGRYYLQSGEYKSFKEKSDGELSAWECQQIMSDVCDMYYNSLKQHLDNHPFKLQKGKLKLVFYRRDIKSPDGKILHKKGDLKTVDLAKRTTPMTRLATMLLKVEPTQFDQFTLFPPKKKDDESATDYNKRLDTHKKKLREINNIKNGPHWNRLKKVVEMRQYKALSRLKVIEYKSGSYRKAVHEGSKAAAPCSYYKEDLSNGKFNSFYVFKIAKKEKIYVPLAINGKYHDLSNVNLMAASNVVLDAKGKLHVYLQNNVEYNFSDVSSHLTNVVGIDLNLKTNLMTVAYHDRCVSYDFDRQFIKKLVDDHRDIDQLGYKNLSPVDLERLNKLRRRAEAYFRQIVAKVLIDFKTNGVTDIVLEDLNFGKKVGKALSLEFGIPYNRLVRMLRLGQIKHWLRQQGNNKDIKVHLVHQVKNALSATIFIAIIVISKLLNVCCAITNNMPMKMQQKQ